MKLEAKIQEIYTRELQKLVAETGLLPEDMSPTVIYILRHSAELEARLLSRIEKLEQALLNMK